MILKSSQTSQFFSNFECPWDFNYSPKRYLISVCFMMFVITSWINWNNFLTAVLSIHSRIIDIEMNTECFVNKRPLMGQNHVECCWLFLKVWWDHFLVTHNSEFGKVISQFFRSFLNNPEVKSAVSRLGLSRCSFQQKSTQFYEEYNPGLRSLLIL